METMFLKYDAPDGGQYEFEYVPFPEEIAVFLFKDKTLEGWEDDRDYLQGYRTGYASGVSQVVEKFYDEIFHALKDEKKFIEFITNRHTPEELENETL